MAIYYSETNKREYFSAPQFTRMRHRFRGPRESYKVNLEIDQLNFSVRKLYETYGEFKTSFITKAETLVEGGAITGVYDEDGTTVLSVSGIETLAARIEQTTKRLIALEA